MKIPRIIVHLPVGIFNAWLFTLGTAYGFAFLLMFLLYEINEDWHIRDSAYLDLASWMWGFVIGTVMMGILRFAIYLW